MKVSAVLVAEVPAEVVTVTSTEPVDPAGATADSEVAEVTLNEVAAVDPNLTAVAPVKPLPVTVTEVPPLVGPDEGATAVTVGAAGVDVDAATSTPTPPDAPLGLWVAVGCTAPVTSTS